jgi:ribonuclease HI
MTSYKLSPQASIFTAEAMAIYEALIWLFEANDPGGNALILSDSQSVLNGLQQDPHQMRNCLLLDIVELVKRLGTRGMTVAFAWVKGHAKIQGNQRVDTLAKAAITLQRELKKVDCLKIITYELLNSNCGPNGASNGPNMLAPPIMCTAKLIRMSHRSP